MTFVKNFIRDNSSQIEKYQKYFKSNDWSKPYVEKNDNGEIVYSRYYYVDDIKQKGSRDLIHEGKSPEYKIQDTIVQTVLDRLKHFHSVVESDIGKDKKVDSMIKKMVDFINNHLSKVDKYLRDSNSLDSKEENESSEKTVKDYQSDEIKFDNILYKNKAKISDEVKKLNLERDNEDSILELLNGQKAPLSMREVIEREFPDVRKKVESMKLDFKSPPKNEMFIHIENPPVWNEDKHYFEQDKKTLQFYIDEYKKIKRGITIDGVYITPWMYCHLNIFKTDIPVDIKNDITGEIESVDKMMSPPLRDNEWFIIQDSYQKAKKENRMMFLCATRRAAKTTLIASHLQWNALKGSKELVVAGGSTKDLGQIEKNFRKTLENCHPAFALPNTSNDWKDKVRLGVKKKNQKNIYHSTLNVVNLNSGGDKSSEVLAGFTPDCFVLDECMKAPFLEQLDAAKPAFEAGGKKRFVPILSGTGGNEDLSKDALRVLKDPEKQDISDMDWDSLERGVHPDYITWKRRKFGTFLPAQMSVINAHLREEVTLGEYLGFENCDELNNIKIQITNWKDSITNLKQRRSNKSADKVSLTKEIVYFPIDPEEIFLSGKPNPFPREEIKKYKERLELEGDVGKKVVLDYDQAGNVVYELSNKEYPPLPYSGGFHDAPVTIFEDPVPNAPFEFYVAGLDDYKQEQASSDSVGSFSIIRRDTGSVVASYHSRPDPHTKFHRQGMLLLELYKSPVFMENEDMGFKEYTDRMETTDEYIIKTVNFLGDLTLDSNGRRMYGWTPTPKNKSYLLGLLINITKKTDTYEDSSGKVRERWGFERIKDLRILEEMINFKYDGNFDAITSLMSAYAYDYYLTANFGAPKPPMTDEEKRLQQKRREESAKKIKTRSLFPRQVRRSGRFPGQKRR